MHVPVAKDVVTCEEYDLHPTLIPRNVIPIPVPAENDRSLSGLWLIDIFVAEPPAKSVRGFYFYLISC